MAVTMETVFDQVCLCLRCLRRTWEETPSVQSLQPTSADASRIWTEAAGTELLGAPSSPSPPGLLGALDSAFSFLYFREGNLFFSVGGGGGVGGGASAAAT